MKEFAHQLNANKGEDETVDPIEGLNKVIYLKSMVIFLLTNKFPKVQEHAVHSAQAISSKSFTTSDAPLLKKIRKAFQRRTADDDKY